MNYSRYAERQITTVQQLRGESLYDYLMHFDSLLERYTDHGLTKYDILDSFLHGMDPVHYERLTYAAGGSLDNLYDEEVWELIYDVAGIPRTSDQQQAQVPLKDPIEALDEKFDKMTAMLEKVVQKVDRQDADLKDLKEQISVLARAVLERQEADQREKELKSEDFRHEADSCADCADLFCADLTEFSGKSSGTAHDNCLGTAHASEVKNKIADSDFSLPPPMQVYRTAHEDAWDLSYKKRMTAHAYKKIPGKQSKDSCHENVGQELDWERTGMMLPYKRCQRKRYVAIRKFDHIYPWDPGL